MNDAAVIANELERLSKADHAMMRGKQWDSETYNRLIGFLLKHVPDFIDALRANGAQMPSEITRAVERLNAAFMAATPQKIKTAEQRQNGEYECPLCGGEGSVEAEIYNNYDQVAIGVQFFGVGEDHVRAEELYEALIEEVPKLIAHLRSGFSPESAKKRARRKRKNDAARN